MSESSVNYGTYDVNHEPNESWYWKKDIVVVRNGKEYKQRINTMYIEMVEHLLHSLHPKWSLEVINFTLTDLQAVVHVRLFVTGKYFDGVGVVLINNPDAFWGFQTPETGLPLAETVALLDAAHKVGPIFGANINRVIHDDIQAQKVAAFDTASCGTMDELVALFDTLDDSQKSDEFIKMAFAKRKVELKYGK